MYLHLSHSLTLHVFVVCNVTLSSGSSHSLFTSSSFATVAVVSAGVVIGVLSLTLHVFVVYNFSFQEPRSHVHFTPLTHSSRLRRRFDLSRRLSLTLHVFVVCNIERL